MSAFVVNRDHIAAIVRYGLAPQRGTCGSVSWYATDPSSEDWDWRTDRRELRLETADVVGQMLTDENVRSVSHRYPGNESLPGTYPDGFDKPCGDWGEPFHYSPMQPGRCPTAVEVLKLLSCLEYQSCEHPGWRSSEARRFCEALRDWAINALPGYDDADWEYRPQRLSVLGS